MTRSDHDLNEYPTPIQSFKNSKPDPKSTSFDPSHPVRLSVLKNRLKPLKRVQQDPSLFSINDAGHTIQGNETNSLTKTTKFKPKKSSYKKESKNLNSEIISNSNSTHFPFVQSKNFQPNSNSSHSKQGKRNIRSNSDFILHNLGIEIPKSNDLQRFANSPTNHLGQAICHKSSSPRKGDNCQLFVKNPPTNTNIQEVFGQYGHVHIEPRGRSFLVTFPSHEAASKAKHYAKPLNMIWGNTNHQQTLQYSHLNRPDPSNLKLETGFISNGSKENFVDPNDPNDHFIDLDDEFENESFDYHNLGQENSHVVYHQDDDSNIDLDSEQEQLNDYQSSQDLNVGYDTDTDLGFEQDPSLFATDQPKSRHDLLYDTYSDPSFDEDSVSNDPQSISNEIYQYNETDSSQDVGKDWHSIESKYQDHIPTESWTEYYDEQGEPMINYNAPDKKNLGVTNPPSLFCVEQISTSDDDLDQDDLVLSKQDEYQLDDPQDDLLNQTHIIQDQSREDSTTLTFNEPSLDKVDSHIYTDDQFLDDPYSEPSSLVQPTTHSTTQIIPTSKKSASFTFSADYIFKYNPSFVIDTNLPSILCHQFEASKPSLQGLCLAKCPLPEIKHRENTNDLSKFEMLPGTRTAMPLLAVKKYKRSSGNESDLNHTPEVLRPAVVLDATLEYLVTYLLDNESFSKDNAYDFISDRMRSIRQDYLVQGINNLLMLSILERIARFHILCEYELSQVSTFNANMNIEQLVDTLVNCNALYKNFRLFDISCPFEGEIQSYRLLLFAEGLLTSGNVLHISQVLIDVPTKVYNSSHVQFALNVCIAITTKNYFRIFKLFKQASYLQACLMHRLMDRIRVNALKLVYALDSMPLDDFSSLLCLERDQGRTFCESHSLRCQHDLVILKKSQYAMPKYTTLPEFHAYRIVDTIRGQNTLSYYVNQDIKSIYIQYATERRFQDNKMMDGEGILLNHKSNQMDEISSASEYSAQGGQDNMTLRYSSLKRISQPSSSILASVEKKLVTNSKPKVMLLDPPNPLSQSHHHPKLSTDRNDATLNQDSQDKEVKEFKDKKLKDSKNSSSSDLSNPLLKNIMKKQFSFNEKLSAQNQELLNLKERLIEQQSLAQHQDHNRHHLFIQEQELQHLKQLIKNQNEKQTQEKEDRENLLNLLASQSHLIHLLRGEKKVDQQLNAPMCQVSKRLGSDYQSLILDQEIKIRQAREEEEMKLISKPLKMMTLIVSWLQKRYNSTWPRASHPIFWYKLLLYVDDTNIKPLSAEDWLLKKLSNLPKQNTNDDCDKAPSLYQIEGTNVHQHLDKHVIYFEKMAITLDSLPRRKSIKIHREQKKIDIQVAVKKVSSISMLARDSQSKEGIDSAQPQLNLQGSSALLFLFPTPTSFYPADHQSETNHTGLGIDMEKDSTLKDWISLWIGRLKSMIDLLPSSTLIPLLVLCPSLINHLALIREEIEALIMPSNKISYFLVTPLVNLPSLASHTSFMNGLAHCPTSPFLEKHLSWLLNHCPSPPRIAYCRLHDLIQYRLNHVIMRLEKDYYSQPLSYVDHQSSSSIGPSHCISHWNQQVSSLIDEVVNPQFRHFDWPAPEFEFSMNRSFGLNTNQQVMLPPLHGWNSLTKLRSLNTTLNGFFLPEIEQQDLITINFYDHKQLIAYLHGYNAAMADSSTDQIPSFGFQFTPLRDRLDSIVQRYINFASHLESAAKLEGRVPVLLPFPWHLIFDEILAFKLEILADSLYVGVFETSLVSPTMCHEYQQSRRVRKLFDTEHMAKWYLSECDILEHAKLKEMKEEVKANDVALVSYVDRFASSRIISDLNKPLIKVSRTLSNELVDGHLDPSHLSGLDINSSVVEYEDEEPTLNNSIISDSRIESVASSFQYLDKHTTLLGLELDQLLSRAQNLTSLRVSDTKTSLDNDQQKHHSSHLDSIPTLTQYQYSYPSSNLVPMTQIMDKKYERHEKISSQSSSKLNQLTITKPPTSLLLPHTPSSNTLNGLVSVPDDDLDVSKDKNARLSFKRRQDAYNEPLEPFYQLKKSFLHHPYEPSTG